MATFSSYPLSYVASYKFSSWQVSLGSEKEGENPPQGTKGWVFEDRQGWYAPGWQPQGCPPAWYLQPHCGHVVTIAAAAGLTPRPKPTAMFVQCTM